MLMRAFYSFLNRICTVPVLILAAIVFVCFIVYFLPMQKAATAQYTEHAGSIGLSFSLYRIRSMNGPKNMALRGGGRLSKRG